MTAPLWILHLALQALGTLLAADFVSGLVHWLEDAYGKPDTPVTGRWITQPNILHHREPRAFLKKSWWASSWDLLALNSLLVLVAWLGGHLTWHVWLFAILGANANELHKWAHRTARENGRLITWLQRCRIIQSTRHHALHHTNPKNTNYCTITEFLNPLLDRIRFWEGLEWILSRIFGLRRRIDPTVPPAGGAAPRSCSPRQPATIVDP